ncbi:MAG: PIG-L family deacetylase [Candidatus Methanoperedens sp.]|nr:PIG-L family deacetylase [Candidatus Methanoperedens sp.]
MLVISLNQMHDKALRVLCLGAHSDDIEIGCGGTILKLIEQYPNISFYWVVFGSKGLRTEEALKSANDLLNDVQDKQIFVKGFRDSFFPYIGGDIKEYFEQIKRDLDPDIIFTHYRQDLHQDHRLISDLTWNTFRNHLILEYEVPKYDGDMGSPNFFVNLDGPICRKKIKHLHSHFKTQTDRQWFSEETFRGLLRLRGIESNSLEKYAEAFYCRKIVI